MFSNWNYRIRGRLGSLLMLCVSIGILFGFTFGTYLAYFLVPKIFAPLPILFFAAFFFFPETPQYFISRKNFEVQKLYSPGIKIQLELLVKHGFCFLFGFQKAKRSLRYYRGCRCDKDNAKDTSCPIIDAEFNEILQSIMEYSCQNEQYRKHLLRHICEFEFWCGRKLLWIVIIPFNLIDIFRTLCICDILFNLQLNGQRLKRF